MRIFLTSIALFISALLIAQAPALIPYQAVARDASGQPLANTNVNARFTIHDGSATGVNVWQELQTVSTSALGLFTVQLGSSMPLSGVNWADGSKFMQVEIDLGSGFVDIGTQQMLSVPYALHSEDANRAGNGISDISPTGDTLYLANGNFVIVPGISAANYNPAEGPTAHSCGAIDVHNPNLVYGTMTDQDDNSYKTIIIGSQEWMAENLQASHYRNGDLIPVISDTVAWVNTTTGATCWFNNDSATYNCPYGKLYNWFAATDARNLCPTGWHVPSDVEWTVLVTYLGGETVAGGKMKTTSTQFWLSPNIGATNETGFSGLPGSSRFGGIFPDVGVAGQWQSSTEYSASNSGSAYIRSVVFDDAKAYRGIALKRYGYSVRCVRD